jgi:hypothetical protein
MLQNSPQTPITVKMLIEHLSQFPENLPVCYEKYSELVLLEKHEVRQIEACNWRPDGWVHTERPDKEKIPYVCFPGN